MKGVSGAVGENQRRGGGDQTVAGLEQAPGRETLSDFLRGEAFAFLPKREHFGVTGGLGQAHPLNELGERLDGI